MIQRYLLCCAALLGVVLATPAKAISIEPGEWEMSFQMSFPMMPQAQPQPQTYTDCIEESEFDPEDIAMDENGECTVSAVEENGNTLMWTMDCPRPEGATSGTMEFTSHGDTIEGKGTMKTNMGGQSMEMSMNWTGKRLGACSQ